ncbi:hypothetical protein OOZ15_00105 [Galbibacter sp. EGI 63066]|uniref:hypothetical protein n=1 Tax=Galbibacter sp. EGI 63066 TaxID=2993559 RepID=UPI0022497F66|nr:hypothetical protein [Galbibacter sp. EGI 63066]MCX2678331.1 hypothetical protein [Galbibacter sp. EGI 63066]
MIQATDNIEHLIPQKHPFVMIDTLVVYSDTGIESSFTPKEGNIFLKEGIFSEPGIVENMAQTIALHTGYKYFLKGEEPPVGYIGSIKKVKIAKLPRIGETITTKASILHEFMGVTMVSVKVFDADDEEIALGEMKTVIAASDETNINKF